ncbi:MAG: hypothetical protein V4615_10405 [Bacteroidota bacterium]
MNAKHLFLALVFFLFAHSAYSQLGGYATVRVFDCNKAIGMGSGYIAAKIFIVYEDGNTEDIPLLPYSEKNELENLKKINQTINKLKSKGYFLIAQYTTGEQGNLISDYTFLKQQ